MSILERLSSIKLDNIVKQDINQDALSHNFKVIIDILKEHELTIGNLRTEYDTITNNISDINHIIQGQQKNIGTLLTYQTQQTQVNTKVQEEIDQIKKDINKLQENIDLDHQKMPTYEKDIIKLQEQQKTSQTQLEKFTNDIEKLKQQIFGLSFGISQQQQPQQQSQQAKSDAKDNQDKQKATSIKTDDQNNLQQLGELQKFKDDYVTKLQFEQKCQEYDHSFTTVNGDLNDLKDRVNKLEEMIKNLQNSIRDKIDAKKFDAELAKLRTLLLNLDGKDIKTSDIKDIVSAGMTQEQSQKLDNLVQQQDDFTKLISDLKNQVQKLDQFTNAKFGQYDNSIREVQKQSDNLQKQIDEIKAQINDQLKQIKEIDSEHKETKSHIRALESTLRNQDPVNRTNVTKSNTPNGLDLVELFGKLKDEVRVDIDDNLEHIKNNEKKIQELQRIVDYLSEQIKLGTGQQQQQNINEELLNQKLKQLKDELMKMFDALREELGKKCSLDDLYKSDALLLEKVDDIAGALIKKLADKKEVVNSLNYLDVRINEILATLNNPEKQNEGEGLLVKRQLLWSCASCDKNLDKFNGNLGQHRNWAVFPPKETTPERLGKFVKGYKTQIEKYRIKEEKYKNEVKSNKFNQTNEFPQIIKNQNSDSNKQLSQDNI